MRIESAELPTSIEKSVRANEGRPRDDIRPNPDQQRSYATPVVFATLVAQYVFVSPISLGDEHRGQAWEREAILGIDAAY